MKEKKQNFEITGEEYINLSNDYTERILRLNIEIEKNDEEIQRELKYLNKLTYNKETIEEKIKKLKDLIYRLEILKNKLTRKLRKYRKLISNINYSLNELRYEDVVIVDIRKYNLGMYEEDPNKVLTPDLYDKITSQLNEKISKTIDEIDDIQKKLLEAKENLNKEETKKSENKKLLKESKNRLSNLTSIENSKKSSIKNITKDYNKLNKQVVKTKKR